MSLHRLLVGHQREEPEGVLPELEILAGDVAEFAQLLGADVSKRSEETVRELRDELTRTGSLHARRTLK